jgi:hypothetical protein
MSDWETRMSIKAKGRAFRREIEKRERNPLEYPPLVLSAQPLPVGESDIHPRYWCGHCGLPDAPTRTDYYDHKGHPCPECGSEWRWFGRLADLRGTATGPAPNPSGCDECVRWGRLDYDHQGWTWWRICGGDCPHAHHESEVSFA